MYACILLAGTILLLGTLIRLVVRKNDPHHEFTIELLNSMLGTKTGRVERFPDTNWSGTDQDSPGLLTGS